MDRNNPYETAFEGYLRWHKLPYMAINETHRSHLGEGRVKSLDFVVLGEQGTKFLIDVKGRRYPGGPPARPRRVWESWSTRDDVDGLLSWADRYGPGYEPLLVFLYRLTPAALPLTGPFEIWTWHECKYVLRAVRVAEYRAAMRSRSPKWGTVTLPAAAFRKLARPFSDFWQDPAWAPEAPAEPVPF
jgi:hypothetical protein